MNHIWSAAHTDVGIKKNINQDALILKIAKVYEEWCESCNDINSIESAV